MDKQHLLSFGCGLLSADFTQGRAAALVTMPVPWRAAQGLMPPFLGSIHIVESMDLKALETLERGVPRVAVVVGLGGGSALDAAKYVAWRRGLPLLLIPSAVSVDACVTSSIAVREGGRVRYVGHVVPERILVDFELIRRAPARLNRAGAGDILSIHTALYDWQLAQHDVGETYDLAVASAAAALVDELDQAAEDVRRVSDEGIRFLVQAFARVDALLERLGSARPEEGSEHFFAYNLEYRTGRHFVHGELVGLGIALLSLLQGNRPDYALCLLRRLGVAFTPQALELAVTEVVETLATLPDYVRAENLPYSQANRIELARPQLEKLVRLIQETETADGS